MDLQYQGVVTKEAELLSVSFVLNSPYVDLIPTVLSQGLQKTDYTGYYNRLQWFIFDILRDGSLSLDDQHMSLVLKATSDYVEKQLLPVVLTVESQIDPMKLFKSCIIANVSFEAMDHLYKLVSKSKTQDQLFTQVCDMIKHFRYSKVRYNPWHVQCIQNKMSYLLDHFNESTQVYQLTFGTLQPINK